MGRRAAVVPALLAIAWALSCTHDFDRYNFDGGGDGGHGGATTSPGGSGGSGGSGGAPECIGPFECPGPVIDCQTPTCELGVCGTFLSSPNTPCDDGGGLYCDGNGHCVECNLPAHCPSGSCQNHVCIPEPCLDGAMNGDETDVDCGGSCPVCSNGLGCNLGADCQSGFCDTGGGGAGGGSAGTCQPCGADVDCEPSGWCDVDICVPELGDGDPCTADVQCQSGSCPPDDGVCCDLACAGICESCLAVDTGALDGSCAPVTGGTDPGGECQLDASQCRGDFCSGTGASCAPLAQGTSCRAAAADCDAEELCDGQVVACPADAKLPLNTP
jgi:hypothetical protein